MGFCVGQFGGGFCPRFGGSDLASRSSSSGLSTMGVGPENGSAKGIAKALLRRRERRERWKVVWKCIVSVGLIFCYKSGGLKDFGDTTETGLMEIPRSKGKV